MTTLVRWDPFTDMSGLRRAMDILEDFAPIRVWRNPALAAFTFPTDLFETDGHVVVKAVLPGVNPDEVEISVAEGILTIRGEVKDEPMTEPGSYCHREIRYGTFSRSIALPVRVDHEQAEADFSNGILTVSLPKAEEVRPKTIKVRAKELAGAAS